MGLRTRKRGIRAYPADEELLPDPVREYVEICKEMNIGTTTPVHTILEYAGKLDNPDLDSVIEQAKDDQKKLKLSTNVLEFIHALIEEDLVQAERHLIWHFGDHKPNTYIAMALLVDRSIGKVPIDEEAVLNAGYELQSIDE